MSEGPLYRYEVGTLYVPGRTTWPEQIEYNWRDGAHELRIFFPGLRRDEVEAVRHGSMELCLVVLQPVIFLCVRFGRVIDWSDAPYSWHMVPEEQRSLPPAPEETMGIPGSSRRCGSPVFAGTSLASSTGRSTSRQLSPSIRPPTIGGWSSSEPGIAARISHGMRSRCTRA